jgi:hypothetical protein
MGIVSNKSFGISVMLVSQNELGRMILFSTS